MKTRRPVTAVSFFAAWATLLANALAEMSADLPAQKIAAAKDMVAAFRAEVREHIEKGDLT